MVPDDENEFEEQRTPDRSAPAPLELRDSERQRLLSDSQRQRHAERWAQDVPVVAMLTKPVPPEEQRHIEELRRSPVDAYEVAWHIAKELRRLREDEATGQRERRKAEEKVLELPHRMLSIEKTWGTWSKVGLLIAGSLVTGAIWLADKISTSAERVGAQTEKLQNLERELRDARQEIRDLRRGKDSNTP